MTASYDFNKNPALQPTAQMMFPRFNTVNFFITDWQLPGITMGGVETPYRNNATSMASNRLEYETLNIQVMMDEDWKNYEAIWQWMKDIECGDRPLIQEFQDIELHIMDANYKLPFIGVKYFSAYPTMISEIPFMIQSTDTLPVMFTIGVRYQKFDFIRKV